MTIEFTAWPKTPRLFRDMIVTEKIDGTNAAIHIVQRPRSEDDKPDLPEGATAVVAGGMLAEDVEYVVAAQSRNRLITPGKTTDNSGFAAWVLEHAFDLIPYLGTGVHYGEWWGSGIQRGYDLPPGERRFSLFNVHKYGALGVGQDNPTDTRVRVPGLGLVPLLAQYTFGTEKVEEIKADLVLNGSKAAPGYMNPEGVIVYHTAARATFKSLIEADDRPKGDV